MDLSIAIPAIRTSNWFKLYQSIEKSCTKYSWELILISPFDLPKELKEYKNIKLIKDLGHPTRCLQLGIFEASGKLFYHTTDDALCIENKIDEAIDFYNNMCGEKDVINMRYREGENYSGNDMPMEYWHAWYHGPLRLPGIPSNYKLAIHHMLKTDYLVNMGGYDCAFEHANFSLHDLAFRVQFDGGKVFNSPSSITSCNHYPDKTIDHEPIFISHNEHDLPLFTKIYSNPNTLKDRNKIDINNWSEQSSIWTRRFKTIPKDYLELIEK